MVPVCILDQKTFALALNTYNYVDSKKKKTKKQKNKKNKNNIITDAFI